MDPFSDVLQLLEASTVVSRGLIATGRWALRFPRPGQVKFSVVARGRCWMCLDGRPRGVWLEEGDVMLLPGRDGFVVAGDAKTEPKDAHRVIGKNAEAFVRIGKGSGPECTLLTGMVSLHPTTAELLTEVLPPLVHVSAMSPQATSIRWIVEQLLHERSSSVPGAQVASTQLAQLLFVQILRAHLASSGTLPPGWLRAMRDERLTPALVLMHSDPAHAWTVGELARAVAMSRTSFAVRFREVVGVPPLTYLLQWRMRLAQKRLRKGDAALAEIAEDLGYGSESAFSNAFKRVTGTSPGRYRRALNDR